MPPPQRSGFPAEGQHELDSLPVLAMSALELANIQVGAGGGTGGGAGGGTGSLWGLWGSWGGLCRFGGVPMSL